MSRHAAFMLHDATLVSYNEAMLGPPGFSVFACFCFIFQRCSGKVTNNNMKKMVEWSVAANRAETGWLAAKLDTTEDRLIIRIQMVQDALATSNTAALQEAKEARTPKTQQIPAYCSMFPHMSPFEVSGSMLEELAGADVGAAGCSLC